MMQEPTMFQSRRVRGASMALAVALLALPSASCFSAPACGVVKARPSITRIAMSTDPCEASMALSRRSFFKNAAGVSALTIGALGIEVPQSFAEGLPGVNAPAPDFSLPSNRGKDLGLADLKGKWTVLYFYPGDFTSGCTIEAQSFEKNAASIRALGAEIVGVSVDSVDKHLDFAKTYGLSFPLLSDNGGKVSSEYGSALKIPFVGTFSNRQTYLIDPEGKLRWVFTDVQSRLAKHAEEVISKLKELTA